MTELFGYPTIRCHDTKEAERPGWGRLNLRLPPELWSALQSVPVARRGPMIRQALADQLGVRLVKRTRGGNHGK